MDRRIRSGETTAKRASSGIRELHWSTGRCLFIAFIDYRIVHVNSATAAFTFLLLVLALATRVGLRESIIASVASMLAYNYFFLPPIGTLTVSDPQNWVALFAFLATAITTSQLSSSARRKADEAGAREQEVRRMYDFSRALMLGDADRPLNYRVTRQLSQSFGLNTVSFYEAATDTVSEISDDRRNVPEALLRRVSASGETWSDSEQSILIVPVRLGRNSLGSIGIAKPEHLSKVALEAVAQLVAIAMERARAQQRATLLEATRQNEQLKSTLLDALAHEFKTPLTSVKVAATTLLSRDVEKVLYAELLTIIDEEADRMTQLVNDSIELARIGTGPVALHRGSFSVETLISSTIEELRPLFDSRDLNTEVEPSLPMVDIDGKLTRLALRQILNNAIKYSAPGSPVEVKAKRSEDRFVLLSVRNEGKEISKSEQALLFDKFYRGQEARTRVPGTGLGLNITREIIQAQGGRIWVTSEPGAGVQFMFTLPIEQRAQNGFSS